MHESGKVLHKVSLAKRSLLCTRTLFQMRPASIVGKFVMPNFIPLYLINASGVGELV
jgi:hypothetical protein